MEIIKDTIVRYNYILNIMLVNEDNFKYYNAIKNLLSNFISYVEFNEKYLKSRYKSLKNIFHYNIYKKEFDEYIYTVMNELSVLNAEMDLIQKHYDKLNNKSNENITHSKHCPSWDNRANTDAWYSQIEFIEIPDGKPES